MCGRYSLSSSPDELFDEFGIHPPADYTPRYNIAPQQQVAIVGRPQGDALEFATMQWGLVPSWSEDGSGGARSINARAETLLDRPTFRDPFLYRRCWVLADGFYEWTGEDKARQPWRFQRRDSRAFAFAGLWDRWTGEDGGVLFTCAIITTDAGPIVRGIHDRMPVILSAADRLIWLEPEAHPDALSALLRPHDGNELQRYTVSPAVNSVTNDSPELIEPHEAQGELFTS
jgi:putative SOS response-associated peptidase YedK